MRIIKLEGACNCRDLGGYVTGDGRFQVAYGKLYRSDQLSGLNQRDLAILEQLGIRTVVDYRLPREYQRAANSQWPALKNIVHLVPDAEAVETAAAASNDHEKVDKLLRQAEAKKQIINGSGLVMEQQNRDFVNSPQVTRVYRQLLELLLEQENLPLLQECRGGKDRTGFGVAIILSILGVSEQDILTDYVLTDSLRKERNRKRLAEYRNETDNSQVLAYLSSMMEARPAYLKAAFLEMQKLYGSVTGYLQQALKVTEEEKKQLQKIYLVSK